MIRIQWQRVAAYAALAVLIPSAAAAQQASGRVTGRIIEAERGLPLGGAIITLVGTTHRASSLVDGRYALINIPDGAFSLRVVMIGYTPKTVTGIVVKGGEITQQDVAMSAQAAQVAEITVTSKVENGTVAQAMDEQRTSVGIINAISSEQMKRSPDGDASAAAQRLSGATIEDGRTPNMRGLGDRYTTGSLDGVRIPSPEPERRTVPLDLFPAGLIESISARKTFTPDLPGDFSGGALNIRMKDFTGRRYVAFSVSSGLNSDVAGTMIGFAPSANRDWLALGSTARSLPTVVANTDFSQVLSPSQTNTLVNAFRRVWSVRDANGGPNSGFGLSVGGALPGPGNGIGYLLSGNYSYSQEIRSGEERAQAQPSSSAGGAVTPIDHYAGSTGRRSALWGGIANFGLTLGEKGKLSFHNMYNRTMDNEGRNETGTSEKLGYPLEVQRLRYVERGIYSSQLALHHEGSATNALDASITFSGVTRKEPDRSEIVYETSTGQPAWLGFSNEAAVRTFGNLKEHAMQGDLAWQFHLGATRSSDIVRVGASYRSSHRDANNRAYSITLLHPLSANDQYLAPEQLFDGRFTSSSANPTFAISPTSAGGSYTADDRLAAGFVMMTSQMGKSLELTGGVRVEHSEVEVSSLSSAYEPSLANPKYTDILPSLAATLHFGDRVNLRLSASQTLSRPEYRELSPITYREVLGEDNIRGNAALKRALIQNYDIRYEFYPSRAEVLSVALFAKEFSNPVERIYQGTSDQHVVTFVNAKAAHNVGVEFEARKGFQFLGESLRSVSAFTNLTLMHSRISLDPASGSLTHADRKMVGQAPYVVNAGLTWTHPSADASATLLFNRVGERIVDAGEIPLPDVVEAPRNMIDASVLVPLFSTLHVRLDGKNLLDAAYRRTQGAVVREGYHAGRVFSIGFSWTQ